MNNVKTKIIAWLTGKLGPLITPIISGIVGTLIGSFYAWMHGLIEKVPALKTFFDSVWNSLDATSQAALHPAAIGAIVAGIAYAIIQEWLNKYFVSEVKKDQTEINKILPSEQEDLKVDGVPGPVTREAKEKVNAAAQVAIRNMMKK